MSNEPRHAEGPGDESHSNGFPSLPMIDVDPEGLDPEDRPTILITGASGHLGRKLRAAWADQYDLILLDRSNDHDTGDIIVADLSEQDDDWMGTFHGADAVVHLAGNPDPNARWDDLVGPNVDAMANVLHASVLGAVERVVFASSSHTMWGYRDEGDGPIAEHLPPRPDGPYGASKVVGERLGRSFALAFELTFIALRIGWVQHGLNRPETLPDDWARSLWLSDRDLVSLFEQSLWAELNGEFLVVNGTSRNQGGRWPIARAVEVLGFNPVDDAFSHSI